MIRYYPRDTFIHRAHPLLKLAVVLATMLASIAFLSLPYQLGIFAVVLLFIILAKLPLREVVKFAWIFVVLAPIMLVVQAVIYPVQDYVVIELLGLKAYHSGVVFGLVIAFRLLSLGFLAPLVIMTTRVSDLLKSAEKYLPKYLIFGLALAFKFVPIFEEELNRIRMAKEARATKRDLRYLASLLVPLFSKALKRSKTMSYSLESRGFSAQ